MTGPTSQSRVPRTVADFGALSAAESALIEHCQTGAFTIVGDLPAAQTETNRVRGSLLRFLATGTDPAVVVYALGIQLQGAWITGVVDLEGAVAGCEIYCDSCVFEQIDLQRAKVRYVALVSCVVHGACNGDDVQCDGGLLLKGSTFHGSVSLARSRIQGPVDCSGSRFLMPGDALSFDGARITSMVLLRDGFAAKGAVRMIQVLIESSLEARGGRFDNPDGIALYGDRMTVGGSVLLGDGFHASGEVKFLNAKIGGNLECTGARFECPGGDALSCDGAAIGGALIFGAGAVAAGCVRLVGSKIGIDLDCCGGSIANPGGSALMADGVTVARSVFLRSGFHASGEVRFLRAGIGETLDCTGAAIDNGAGTGLLCDGARVHGDLFLRGGFACRGDVRLVGITVAGNLSCIDCTIELPGGTALSCDGAAVGRTLFFRSVGRIDGGVDLSGTHVGTLCDDAASWDAVTGPLALDGFTYDRFAGTAPTAASVRVQWLAKQGQDDLNDAFRPQPWEQLITVLRAMGHIGDARQVAVAKQVRQRQAGKVRGIARPFHVLYGALIGYGYRPARLLVIMAGVWLGCAVAYSVAVHPEWTGSGVALIAPASREANLACLLQRAANPALPACPEPAPGDAAFSPLIYSLDVLMPVVNLGHKAAWRPVIADAAGRPLVWGQALRLLVWWEIIFGWTASVLLVGVLGNLIKKD